MSLLRQHVAGAQEANAFGIGMSRLSNQHISRIRDRKNQQGSLLHVDGHSRYVMLVKVANKDTESVVSALIKQSQRLPSELYRSLTWDRGKELADHQRLTLATEVVVYLRTAQYADRLLKGEKPSDLPVQAPVNFVLTLNLKAAKALGLDVPALLQQRADEVTE
jgi:hypothetical protein